MRIRTDRTVISETPRHSLSYHNFVAQILHVWNIFTSYIFLPYICGKRMQMIANVGTFPETNSSPQKNDTRKTTISFCHGKVSRVNALLKFMVRKRIARKWSLVNRRIWEICYHMMIFVSKGTYFWYAS